MFTASGDERLEGVGVWVTSPAVRVTIDVYTGLADPTDPESGTQATAAHTEFDALNAGYLTPALANAVDLEKGQTFAVIVTETQLYDQQMGPYVVHHTARRRTPGGREPRRDAPLRQRSAR